MVSRQNALKLETRTFDDPLVIRLIERRNLARYGNPVGPSADDLKLRYGSWAAVIEAAARPSKLS